MQAKVYYTLPDTTPPSGGSITYASGYLTAASVPITYTTGSDSGSGLNTSSGKIQRKSATLSNGSCGTFGSFSTVANSSGGSYTDTSVASGNCYMYQYTISDNAGNNATYTSTNVARIDTSAPSVDAGASKAANAQFTQNGSASDSQSGIASYGWAKSSGPGTITFGSPSAASTTISASAEGTYNLTLTATNGAGLSASDSMTLTWDTTGPTLSIITPISTPSNDSTPNLKFNSSEAGTMSYSGACNSPNKSAVSGSNTITYNTLADGTYSNCTITVTDAAGNPSAALAVPSFTIDTAAPKVSSVNTSHLDGAFTVGEIIDITVAYTDSVTVNGTPRMALNSGGTAIYLNGSGTNILTFRYNVSAGENSNDLAYSSTSALTVPNATIRDSAGNNANNTLPAASVFSGAHAIVIDTTAPAITINNPPTSPPAANRTLTARTNEGTLFMSDASLNPLCDQTRLFVLYANITFKSISDNGKMVCYKAVDSAGNTAYNLSSPIGGIIGKPLVNVTKGGTAFATFAPAIKIIAAKAAASAFVDLVDSSAQMGLVSYSTSATTAKTMMGMSDSNKTILKSAINSLSVNGQTCIWCGLNNSVIELISSRGRYPLAARMVVLLTDGMNNQGDENDMVAVAVSARNNDITVYTVGFGNRGDLDEDELTNIALLTGGKYYYAPDGPTLLHIYENIGN